MRRNSPPSWTAWERVHADRSVHPGGSARRLRAGLKQLLFPGLDLLTRCRYATLPRFLRPGPSVTLDAGCGNGALAYAAYRLGHNALGITSNAAEVHRNREFFRRCVARDSSLAFMQLNLYELPSLSITFDQIICSETLEHVADDELILRYFNQALHLGGVLHLCSPYAFHPQHRLGRVNEPEDGRHVRDGYTLDSYAAILSRTGFDIVASAGLGGPLLVALDRPVRWVRSKLGDAAALPLFLLVLPLTWFDRLNPRVPYSLYVQAVKRRELDEPAAGVADNS